MATREKNKASHGNVHPLSTIIWEIPLDDQYKSSYIELLLYIFPLLFIHLAIQMNI